MDKIKTRPWDSAEHLKTDDDMAEYFDACLREAGDDPAFIAHALGVIARARGMSQVARDAGLSREVTDELPASHAAIRVHGILLRLDRVPKGDGGWSVAVALKLRADAPDGTPLVDELYHEEAAVSGAGIKASVDAYGAVLDRLFARFYADLRKHGEIANAR